MPRKRSSRSTLPAAPTDTSSLPAGVKLVRILRGHKGWIGGLAWSPDGRLLASPSGDSTIRVWDVDTWECLHILRRETDTVYAVAFHPNGKILACTRASTIELWNAHTWHFERVFNSDGHHALAFNPKSGVLASGNSHGIKVWGHSKKCCSSRA